MFFARARKYFDFSVFTPVNQQPLSVPISSTAVAILLLLCFYGGRYSNNLCGKMSSLFLIYKALIGWLFVVEKVTSGHDTRSVWITSQIRGVPGGLESSVIWLVATFAQSETSWQLFDGLPLKVVTDNHNSDMMIPSASKLSLMQWNISTFIRWVGTISQSRHSTVSDNES